MQLEISQINGILSNLQYLKGNKNLEFIERVVVSEIKGYEGSIGEYYMIYQIKNTELFLKANYTTDSYGETSSLDSIQICEKKEVSKFDFVPVN